MIRHLLATDLDRTLLPNGVPDEHPVARPLFAEFVRARGLGLAYVSGRRLELVEAAIEEYEVPRPDYVLADVGSSLYESRDAAWHRSAEWDAWLAEDWGGRVAADLATMFETEPTLEMQEPEAQCEHKLSFYADLAADAGALVERVREVLREAEAESSVIYSIDEAKQVGLLDVLPARSNKLGALEFLLNRLGLSRDSVLFAGDSGNDLEVLLSAVPSVLVANADPQLREHVAREAQALGRACAVHMAQGGFLGMNGNYAAGILEGWAHFHPEDGATLEAILQAHTAGQG